MTSDCIWHHCTHFAVSVKAYMRVLPDSSAHSDKQPILHLTGYIQCCRSIEPEKTIKILQQITRQNTHIAIYNVAGSRYHETAPRTSIKITTVDTYDAQTYTQIIITNMHAWKNRGKYSIKKTFTIKMRDLHIFSMYLIGFPRIFSMLSIGLHSFLCILFQLSVFSGQTYDSYLNFMCSFSQFLCMFSPFSYPLPSEKGEPKCLSQDSNSLSAYR